MKRTRRNIQDPIGPQNPVHKTDITPDRMQEHLQERTSVEDIYSNDETERVPGEENNETERTRMPLNDEELRKKKESGI